MYNILCFGDSNTWGMDPKTLTRFPPEIRWTGILQNELGSDFKIIEEGLVGRTAFMSFPFEPEASGISYFLPCVKSHAPLDLIIIMIGTNDFAYGATPLGIARNLTRYIQTARADTTGMTAPPQILLISPVQITKDFEKSPFQEIFGDVDACIEKSKKYADYVKMIAEENNCLWLDSSEVAPASETDGLHYDEKGHMGLGKKVAEIVKKVACSTLDV
ncbi:GDSL-type esterase/lipase family protein [Methanimicrococcus sp. OttesenSCG-928-J09]|nr:GDSL-type esterase/lipase family protein [Methanimicrococcus sp. OttesenSCG-928-J09]